MEHFKFIEVAGRREAPWAPGSGSQPSQRCSSSQRSHRWSGYTGADAGPPGPAPPQGPLGPVESRRGGDTREEGRRSEPASREADRIGGERRVRCCISSLE